MNTTPWMVVHLRPHQEGGLDEVEIECAVCHASAVAPVDPANRWVGRIAVGFAHTPACIVPARLQWARAAYRN